MFGVTTSDDYRPVAWMGRYPVDVTTMLVGLHVAAAILAAILVAIGADSVLAICNSIARQSGPARCGAFSRTRLCMRRRGCSGSRSRCTCCSCSAGKSNALSGGRAYIALYLILLVTPAALLTIWGLWQRSCCCAGSPALHFGIFVAFATIYPRAELFLRIMTKWVVLILAAVYTFQLLAYHAWSDLMVVWTSIGAAFLFIEMHGAGPELPWWDALKTRFAPRPKFHVVPKMHSSRSAETDDVYTSIDPILDKISKFGIGSLTASERRQLDRERERLLKNSE